jgi:AMP-binding enzyme C-terminal domain
VSLHAANVAFCMRVSDDMCSEMASHLYCRYMGRADGQVKLRGFRLELGEIEAVLAGVPGVQDAIVALQDAGSLQAALVSYFTPAAAELQPALVAAAKAKLPKYMVPSAFVALQSLPRLPNGKVSFCIEQSSHLRSCKPIHLTLIGQHLHSSAEKPAEPQLVAENQGLY